MKAKCVLGPPGTGKSTYLLKEVKRLIDDGYALDDITLVSHTTAAANEILTRLNLPRSDKVCTLHALCFRLLKMNSQSVIGNRHLKDFEREVNVPISGRKSEDEGQEVGDMYLDVVSFARNKMITYEEAYYKSERPGTHTQFMYFSEVYDAWKRANYLIDYTDMLTGYNGHDAPPSDGSKVLIVDEAQDLSNMQWAVVDKLISVGEYEQVVIAGDDDQSIYVWGGADTDGMAKFCDRYAASVVVLNQSYRIPWVVHHLSQKLIKQVSNRMDKEYYPREEGGTLVRYGEFQNLMDSSGLPPMNTLILGRTHSIVHEMERELIANLIPYNKEGGRPGMFENRYANALRAFHKMKRGKEPRKVEREAYDKVCYAAYRDGFGVTGMSFESVLNIPYPFIPYYNGVDINEEPHVRVGTIHSSKGKEADRVVLSTELTPRIAEHMAKSLDDEIRVFYVGITRAKHSLDIVGDGFSLIGDIFNGD